MATVISVSSLGWDSRLAKVLSVLIPVLILEPGLVAFAGGTVGHRLLGLKVTKLDGISRINFFTATLRFLVKAALGLWSLLLLLTTRRRQAVHDWVTRSLVVNRSPETLPASERLFAIAPAEEQQAAVTAKRRIVVALAYTVLLTVILEPITWFAISDRCAVAQICSSNEKTIEFVIGFGWLAAMVTFFVAAWKKKLPGCRA